MKRTMVAVTALLLFASHVLAQETRAEPTQNHDASFRLFNTTNIYTLLRLDTRDGRIWQVQWGDKDHRFIEPLNLNSLSNKSALSTWRSLGGSTFHWTL